MRKRPPAALRGSCPHTPSTWLIGLLKLRPKAHELVPSASFGQALIPIALLAMTTAAALTLFLKRALPTRASRVIIWSAK